MKIYLVKRKNTNVRWFDNDSDLSQFLINAPEKISEYTITTIDAKIESEMTGDKVIGSIKEQIQLDSKINVVLGDDYSAKVRKFIEMFKELAPKSPFDVDKMRLSAVKVLDQLQSTQPTKEQFSKVVKKNSEYILYNVSNSVEWYKSVLDVCVFKKLADTCQTETINSVTKGSLWRGHRTPEIMIKNFEKAKTSIK